MLTDRDGFELVLPDGFVAGEGCDQECCAPSCPRYRKLVRCDRAGTCFGQPPAVTTAWICETVVCRGTGAPLIPGRVVIIDDICWRAEDLLLTPPLPPGDLVYHGTDPVECLPQGCRDIRCPQESFFVLGRPCDPAFPPRYFCGVTICGVYRAPGVGCYVVDPASGHYPPDQVPDEYKTIGQGPFETCCGCGISSGLCVECARHFNDDPPVICCYSPNAVLVVDEAYSLQILDTAEYGPGSIRIETTGRDDGNHGLDLIQHYVNRIPFQADDRTFGVGNFPGGPPACGWESGLYHLGLIASWTTILSACEGTALDPFYGRFCNYSGSCNGGGSLVASCSESYTCTQYRHEISVVRDARPIADRVWTEVIRVRAHIEDAAGSNCSGRCAGALFSARHFAGGSGTAGVSAGKRAVESFKGLLRARTRSA